MGVQIQGKDVNGVIIGDMEFVKKSDVWLPCEMGSDMVGTPVLMHYDPSSKVTSFLGGFLYTTRDYYIPKTYKIFKLPSGYHFTSIDPQLDFVTGSPNKLTISDDNTLMANYTVWGHSVDAVVVSFAMGGLYSNGSVSKVWKTTTVAPD
ncbi:hypothetical protein [Levilactobacillus brevis]|uniref:hypothetical protein n=1 Tax=Levilactobacillus brevis TaxID=1580 RepID=UPI000BEA6C23|nr:hypothetical protein [Levilactobacillus brevis]STX19366.1 Uncharacterised protein [Levilactobacillus brevis]